MYLNGEGNHSIEEAIQIGLSNAKAIEAYKTAEEIAKKAANGEKISPVAVGRMIMESYTEQSVKARQLEAGVWRSAKETGVDQQTMEQIAAVAVCTGRSIAFVSPEQLTLTDENGVPHVAEGQYDPKTGMISLNASLPAETLTNYVIKHELAHSIEGTAAGQKLARIVRNEKGTARFEQEVAAKKSQYAKNGQMLSDTEAAREVVAQWIGENLYKSGFAQAIAAGDADTGNAFVRVLDKIRLALGGSQKSGHASQIAALERLFLRAMESENKANTSGQATVYFIPKDKNQTSIKEQLREHLDEINTMDPVADIVYEHVDKGTAQKAAIEEFRKYGYKIEKQGFGTVLIGPEEIKKSTNYIGTPAECAALMAVPKVIKRGKVFAGHDDHKGRSYGTVTIAAPVTINGVRGVVGVVVRQTGKNKYNTHRILMPDGSAFIYEKTKAEPTTADMPTQNGGQGTAIGPASNTKISQNSFGVNSYSMQDGGENSQFDWSGVGEIYEDIYYPKTKWEAEDFNRFFANATKTLQKGDKKNIILSVGNTVYFIEADGYMSGDIISTMPILGNEKKIERLREGFENGEGERGNRDGIVSDSWVGDAYVQLSRSVGDYNSVADGKGASRIDTIYDQSSESDQIGYYRRSDTDNEGEWESAGQTENPVTLPGGAITNDPKVIEEYFRNIYEADSNESAFSMPKNGDGRFSFSFDGNVSDGTNTPKIETNTPETGNSDLFSDIHFQAAERVKNGPQRTVAEGHTLEDLATELGDEELSRRAYMAFQAEEIPDVVDIDGEEMQAASYIDAVKQMLPDDIGAVQAFIKEAEQQLREEVAKAHENGEESNVSRA